MVSRIAEADFKLGEPEKSTSGELQAGRAYQEQEAGVGEGQTASSVHGVH